jgi:hypothetical protein
MGLRYLGDKIDYWLAHIKQPEPWGFKVTMFCPHCKTRLHYMGTRRYQTLAEHVSDPNKEPSFKPYFVCVNPTCTKNMDKGIFWGLEGGRYGGDCKDIREAIGGMDWHIEKHLQKERERKRK